MSRCSVRRREGWQRGSDRARYSFSCALSSGSIWNISVKRKHSYTLHRTLPVSSHLNLRWPSAAPFCFCSAGAFSDRIFPERERQLRQRERPHLCCFVWIRADVASTKQEFQLFSRERNPQTQFTTEMLTYKATKSWANSSALNSIVFLNNTLPWLNKAEKKKKEKKNRIFSPLRAATSAKKQESVIIYSHSCHSKPICCYFRGETPKGQNLKDFTMLFSSQWHIGKIQWVTLFYSSRS